MFLDGRKILHDVLDKEEESLDSMNLLTINVSLLKSDNFSKIFSLLSIGKPSQLGLRIIYLHERNDMQVRAFMRTIRELHSFMKSEGFELPIQVMSLDQLAMLRSVTAQARLLCHSERIPIFIHTEMPRKPMTAKQ